MAKSKKRYFKLGKTASNFYDMGSRVKIAGADTVAEYEGFLTKRLKSALANGHIIEVDGPSASKASNEDDEDEEDTDTTPNFSKMKKKDLIKHFKENYEYDDEELAKFEGLTNDEMVEYLEKP